MSQASAERFSEHLQALFDTGTCAGLTDGELLHRFLAERDRAGELAFESLVTRHGPMVQGVCRRLLDDPTDAHDAFQAVFLVLARRARTIRKRESVGSWLHGVAIRVAARARVTSIRRRVRERRDLAAAGVVAAAGEAEPCVPSAERDEGAAVVHQEVESLPDKYRAPVVLCYLEGLTHDEAAARLSWPVGTVRSRLSRARDRLRTRLTRRGVAAPAALGPVAGWLAGEPGASAATAATAAGLSTPVPVKIVETMAAAASRVGATQPVAAGAWPAAVANLAEGVMRTMMLKKMSIIACVLVPIGIALGGGGAILVRTSRAQDAPKTAANRTIPATKTSERSDPPKETELDRKIRELLDASRDRLAAQRAYYEEGRITLDRFVDACAQLEKVQLLAARTDAERRLIQLRHVELLREIEQREQAEQQVGRGTVADVAEARQHRLEAEVLLEVAENSPAATASILRRLDALEKKVDRLLQDEPRSGRLDLRSDQARILMESLKDSLPESKTPRP
jgi:RNA polymerase sigma factor (sigma-70 family)